MTIGRHFQRINSLHGVFGKLTRKFKTYKNTFIKNAPMIRERMIQGFKKLLNKFKILTNTKTAILVFGIVLIAPVLYFDIDEQFKQHYITFIVGIMTASAALLAVGITVLQMLLSDISKSYSSEVQKILLSKIPVNWSFVLLILTMVGSSLFVVVPPKHIEISLDAVTILFQISLIFFMIVFYSITKLRNPINNIDFMYESIMEGIRQDGDRS